MTTVHTSVKSAPAPSAAEADQSVTDRILTTIRDDIIEGKLLPGTALVENDLTQLHDVSRNTLREALRLLCREGLAVHYRHRGVIVRTLTRHDVRDISRVRRTLELQALVRDEPIEEADLALMREAIRCAQDAALRRAISSDSGSRSLAITRPVVNRSAISAVWPPIPAVASI